jgi:hypothetical protein
MPTSPALAALVALVVPLHDGTGHHHQPPAPAVAPTVAFALPAGQGAHRYESVAGWCRLPDARPLGNTHGAIVIDRRGRVYFNTDTDRSIMVYEPDGRFVRSFAAAHPGIHGMVLNVEDGEEYLYAAHLAGKQVVKLRLDGTVVWTLGVPRESGKYDDDPNAYNPTAVAVAPDGGFFVADGYGRNWIHQFTKDRAYVRSFGGPGDAPGQFRTCHGLALDTRGPEPRLIVCDRENRRLQRFDLEGNLVDVPVTGLRRPCSLSLAGEYTAVAELEGRVTILDQSFQPVAHLGDNPQRGQWANNGVKPAEWIEGVFTAPHACCFDDAGNLYVMDWNASGRISKLRRVRDID